MRRNLIVFSLSMTLFFTGLAIIVNSYPNPVSFDVLGITLTNVAGTYINLSIALAFLVIAVLANYLEGSDELGEMTEATCCCDHDHSHLDACISGIYHDEATGVMVCLNCGTGLKKDFMACPTCGQQIYQECPVCKEVVPTWYNICPYCEYEFLVFEIMPAAKDVPEGQTDQGAGN